MFHLCENSPVTFLIAPLSSGFFPPDVVGIQGVRKPNPPDTLSTFFFPLKGIPGTHSNSTSLQHFLGLHSHPPLCQHSITNCWHLKWTKSATFLLQFIFCEFSKQGLLSIAGWELPPPSSVQALHLFLLSPSETIP